MPGLSCLPLAKPAGACLERLASPTPVLLHPSHTHCCCVTLRRAADFLLLHLVLQTVSAHAHEVAAANKRAAEAQRRADQADSARIAAEEQARQATVWLAKLKVRLLREPLSAAVKLPAVHQCSRLPPC
jgi:hypothetical protein